MGASQTHWAGDGGYAEVVTGTGNRLIVEPTGSALVSCTTLDQVSFPNAILTRFRSGANKITRSSRPAGLCR